MRLRVLAFLREICGHVYDFSVYNSAITQMSGLRDTRAGIEQRNKPKNSSTDTKFIEKSSQLIKTQSISLFRLARVLFSVNKFTKNKVFSSTSASGCHYGNSQSIFTLQPPCDCFVYVVDSHSLSSVFNTFWLHFYELAGRKTQTFGNHLRNIFIEVPGISFYSIVYNFALIMIALALSANALEARGREESVTM